MVVFLTANWYEISLYLESQKSGGSAIQGGSNRRNTADSSLVADIQSAVEGSTGGEEGIDRVTIGNEDFTSERATTSRPLTMRRSTRKSAGVGLGGQSSTASMALLPPSAEEERVQLNVALQKEIVRFTGKGIQKAAKSQKEVHEAEAAGRAIGHHHSNSVNNNRMGSMSSVDLQRGSQGGSSGSFFVRILLLF